MDHAPFRKWVYKIARIKADRLTTAHKLSSDVCSSLTSPSTRGERIPARRSWPTNPTACRDSNGNIASLLSRVIADVQPCYTAVSRLRAYHLILVYLSRVLSAAKESYSLVWVMFAYLLLRCNASSLFLHLSPPIDPC